MSGSAIGIGFIVVVVVVGLALWLAMVARAARPPEQEHPEYDPMRGLAQGGQHVDGGNPLAPEENPLAPEEGKAAYGSRLPRAGSVRNPTDL